MVILGQELLMAGILIFLYYMGKRFYSKRVGAGALILAIVSCQMFEFPQKLLDTTVGTGSALLSLYFLIRYGRKNDIWHCVFAGTFLGIACGLRSNLILFLPVALGWLVWKTVPRMNTKVIRGGMFTMLVICPLLLAGFRNYHVTCSFKLMPTSGPINIWLGNHPASQTEPGPKGSIPTVIDYMESDPIGFVKGILVKTAYVFGFHLPKKRFVAGRFFPALAALIGFIYLMLTRDRYSLQYDELWLLFLWVAINSAVLIAIFPWSYRGRLLAPTYPAIYLIAALFFERLLSASSFRQPLHKSSLFQFLFLNRTGINNH